MSRDIFKEVVDAIKMGTKDLLTFHDVEPHDFEDVLNRLQHPTNYREQYSFRIHWFASDQILKVVMPTKLHECPASWVLEMIMKACGRRIIPEAWYETMQIRPAPEYNNFLGEFRTCMKEADLTFVPRVGSNPAIKAEFPSVVLESGWFESAEQLCRDARLWQEGSGYKVQVVLQVKFYRPNHEDRIRAVLFINRAPNLVYHYEIIPPSNNLEPDPSITLDEFYAGECPPKMDPATRIPLDLARLRIIVREQIIAQGSMPAE